MKTARKQLQELPRQGRLSNEATTATVKATTAQLEAALTSPDHDTKREALASTRAVMGELAQEWHRDNQDARAMEAVIDQAHFGKAGLRRDFSAIATKGADADFSGYRKLAELGGRVAATAKQVSDPRQQLVQAAADFQRLRSSPADFQAQVVGGLEDRLTLNANPNGPRGQQAAHVQRAISEELPWALDNSTTKGARAGAVIEELVTVARRFDDLQTAKALSPASTGVSSDPDPLTLLGRGMERAEWAQGSPDLATIDLARDLARDGRAIAAESKAFSAAAGGAALRAKDALQRGGEPAMLAEGFVPSEAVREQRLKDAQQDFRALRQELTTLLTELGPNALAEQQPGELGALIAKPRAELEDELGRLARLHQQTVDWTFLPYSPQQTPET